MLPAITLSGWALGALISGAVIAENIFGRPGIGQVLVTAVNTRDVPTVAGIVLVVAAVYVVANLLVDLAYAARRPQAACVMSAVDARRPAPAARPASGSPYGPATRRLGRASSPWCCWPPRSPRRC